MALALTIPLVVGIFMLIYGSFFMKKVDEPQALPASTEVNIAAQPIQNDDANRIKQSIEDADAALNNINSVSALIVEEIDSKYKELLFLYDMMEEKKKDLIKLSASAPSTVINSANTDSDDDDVSDDDSENFDLRVNTAPQIIETQEQLQKIGEKMDEIKQFPKLKNEDEILDMYLNGHNITDIARKLKIGKGEVKLIIGLNGINKAANA